MEKQNKVDLIEEQFKLIAELYPEVLTEGYEKWSNLMVTAIVGELGEFTTCYQAFPWKKPGVDSNMALEELIDVLHFVLELFIIWDIRSFDEIEEMYLAKLQKNLARGRVHNKDSHAH